MRLISESHQLLINALQEQTSKASHLRHLTKPRGHHLARVLTERSSSQWANVLPRYKHAFPDNPVTFGSQGIPPWVLPTLYARSETPGIQTKSDALRSALQQCVVNETFHTHEYRSLIYTVGSTCTSDSRAVVVILVDDISLSFQLSHETLTNTLELPAIYKDVNYIISQKNTVLDNFYEL